MEAQRTQLMIAVERQKVIEKGARSASPLASPLVFFRPTSFQDPHSPPQLSLHQTPDSALHCPALALMCLPSLAPALFLVVARDARDGQDGVTDGAAV
eukprot:1200273-Rhodomonas_salina.1